MPPVDQSVRSDCPGPPRDWLLNGAVLRAFGFTRAQAADLAFNSYEVVLPVRVVEEPAVAK